MWFFKKKEEKKVEPEYKEDRFIVTIDKDEHTYKVDVYDKWSKSFMTNEELDRNKLLCNSITFKEKEKEWTEIKIKIIIEKSKDKLRNEFIKNWNKPETHKSKKKKSTKKGVK